MAIPQSEVDRVIAAAQKVAGSRDKALAWFTSEALPEFDHRTAEALVREGKTQVVMDYIMSIEGGASG